MKKKLLALSTTLILGFGGVFTLPNINAEATTVKKIQEQRSGIKAEIAKKNGEISEVQAEITRLTEQVKRIEQAIIDNNNMIVQTEAKVKATESQVNELQKEIDIITERITKRNEVLKQRALSFQESGGKVSYIDVLIGASSFADFVSRLGAVATMMEADQDLVEQHEADKKEVEQKQADVEKKLTKLNEMKTELLGMQEQILEQKEQSETIKEELKAKEQEKLSEKADLQNKDRSLAAEEAAIRAEEQRRASAALNKSSNSSGSNSVSINLSNPASGSEAINIVTNAGRRYIGNSVYVFGAGRSASDVANGRFDCSGFVSWAYAQAGYRLGAYTEILKNAGTRVPASEARPGDLVFFDTYKKDGHVGIYLGGGKFIGSQSSTGIAIADMTSGYYSKKFNGRVVRIINN